MVFSFLTRASPRKILLTAQHITAPSQEMSVTCRIHMSHVATCIHIIVYIPSSWHVLEWLALGDEVSEF